MSEPTRCFVCGNLYRYCRCSHEAPKRVEETGRRSCLQCEFGALVQNGYSNYTVEGTDLFCMKDLHPDAPFDAFYGVDNRLAFADTCPGFVKGNGPHIDVDREDLDELTPAQRAWYDESDDL